MSLRDAVQLASRPEVVSALHDLYARLAGEVAREKPHCDASGRCCDFDAYRHRLYVTPLELAAFLHDLPPVPDPPPNGGGGRSLPVLAAAGACPYQVGGLCSVHAARPFGCRIFYCDPRTTAWMEGAYERFHNEIKALHARFDVPYLYVEWRNALRELNLPPKNPLPQPVVGL